MKTLKLSTERGQALVLIALAAIGLFAMAGLAIDGSAKFSDRRHAQNAADTAALAGALARIKNDPSQPAWNIIALNRAGDNGYDDNLVTNTVQVYNPPHSGIYSNCSDTRFDCNDYVQVTIISHVKTYFARVIGINETINTVESIAKARQGYQGQLYGGASFVGLAPDQCKTIWLSGSSQIDITGGGIFSNSSLDCGVTMQGSHGLNIDMDGAIDMVATGYNTNGNPGTSNIAGGLHGGETPYDYPPSDDMLPSISCTGSATKSGSTMTPGNWSGTFPPSGVTTLNAGTYCINGDFKLGAQDTLSATDVTIYMVSGSIDWNGGAQVNLSAPTSGDFPGLLIYAPMSNTNTMQFNGNGSSTLKGTIFMPAAPIVYNGTGNLNPSYVQIIGYTIELTGSNSTNVVYQDPDNWDENIPGQAGLAQ